MTGFSVRVPCVECHQVGVWLRGRRVLENVSFSVMPGEVVTLLGQSGQGKSVLLKLILGVLEVDQGQILVSGSGVETPTSPWGTLDPRCVLVLQNPRLVEEMSVEENVRLVGASLELFEKLMSECGASFSPFEEFFRVPASHLTFEARKLVSQMRALSANSKVVLLDEPTSGLSPWQASIVSRIIFEEAKKQEKAILVASHDILVSARYSHRCLFLKEGEIVGEVSAADLVFSKDSVSLKERGQFPAFVHEYFNKEKQRANAMRALQG